MCLSLTIAAMLLPHLTAFDLNANARLRLRRHHEPRSAPAAGALRRMAMMDGEDGQLLLTRSEAALRALAYPLGAAAAFRAGAAISVIGQPRMPAASDLPGPHRTVGSRIVRMPSSGARVRLFYPCEPAKAKHAPYCTDGRATSDGMAGLVGFRQLGLSFLLAHLADADSGCLEDAPPDTTQKWPLLVYSHGYGGNFDMAAYFLRSMASMGMVVAAVEHTDGTASSTVLADGARLDFTPSLLSGPQQLDRRAMELLEAATLSNLPTNFAIDPSRIFLGGHSYGAPSALLAAAQASKQKQVDVAGLILHDPALGMGYGQLSGLRSILANIPTVSYTSDEYNRAGVRYGDLTLHVRGAFHGNFVDAPLWAPPIVMRTLSVLIPAAGPADPVTVHNALAVSATAFMSSLRPIIGEATASGAESDDGDLFERVDLN